MTENNTERNIKVTFKTTLREQKNRLIHFLKWILVSGIIGIVIGLVGAAFWHGM